jgi:PKD repeat protein
VFLVQLRTISLPAWREALREAGAELLSFFPHNAHLVRLDPKLLPALASLEFVARIEPYHPAYRLETVLREWLEQRGAGPERQRVRVVAFGWGEAGKSRIARAARELGAEIPGFWPSGHLLELLVDRQQLGRIAAHDDVMWVDRWGPRETDMDLVREDAGTNWLETSFGSCGQGVRGEVFDSGVEDSHADFDGILLHGPHDVQSHGTSTYGIVFGNGNRDGDGDPKATGHLVCAEQGIFADFDYLVDRFAHTQELKQAPYFASFQTNSWGDVRTTQYTSISQEMDDIIWRLDIAITQSMSNAGDQDSRPQAWAKNIISVGGIYHYNTLSTADDEWSFGSSIGPAADGRIKPDVSYWYDSIYTTTTGGGYTASFGGTSASTPETAGVVGLIAQMWAENIWGTDPQGTTVFEKLPHASTIKALLINSAEQYPFSGTSHDLTRVHQGWGRASARNARERAARSFVVDEETPVQLGETVRYGVDVAQGESELKITMVYPDPPGVTSATLHRINDVDLRVTSPSGILYHGNVGLGAGTYSEPGGSPNSIDTVENVFVLSPEPGNWAVEVEAVEVNQDAHLATLEDDVAFALVVTGGIGSACVPPSVGFAASPSPARVGQGVLFDSTVSGGAGEPHTYRWDFDNDTVTDSTEADPVHVYRRPYQGPVKLLVRDAADCPATSLESLTVHGPDLRFDSWFDLSEVDGNANGAVDPGEVWEFRLRLRNQGDEPALGVAARIEPAPSNPGTLLVLQPASSFPDIGVGAVEPSDVLLRFKVGSDFTCGQDAVFTVTGLTSADPANTYPDDVGAVRVLVGGAGPPVVFYADGFESGNQGWSFDSAGEWQLEAPLGLGGQSIIPGQTFKPDPTSAFEGTKVIGTDLTGLGGHAGSYETDVDTRLWSPVIDCSGAVGVELRYARWLNTDPFDLAWMEVSSDGIQWTRLLDSPGDHTDQAWAQQSFDVSAIADREPDFRIRFGLTSDGFGVQGGWNVDAVELRGVTRESCEPYSQTLPGEASGLQMGKDGSGGLTLEWTADCGAGTAFGVYRGDLAAGYASLGPEPGRCAVGGTSTTIPEGPGAGDFFLVVPNQGSVEGGYGADSTGAVRPPAAAACFPQNVAACGL